MEYISNLNVQMMINRGAKKVISFEKDLNAINVFPVADGDTGSNLAYLMSMIIHRQHGSINHSFEQLKRACLEGSRGNSGMIFSQFIIAICDYMSEKKQLTKDQFVEMCELSFQKTYTAVHQPVEGTILTVMRDWVTSLSSKKQRVNSVIELMESTLQDASDSLEQTKYTLSQCRKQNVVDAGAKGFFHFLQGCADGLSNQEIILESTSPILEVTEISIEHSHDNNGPLTYRYCTEFIVEHYFNDEHLQAKLASFGNSLVLVQAPGMYKFHIHTNDPAQIAEYIQSRGRITFQKVEDMKKQQQMISGRKSKLAIVVDSACDLPQDIMDEFDIYMLPLSIQVDQSSYLDKQTLLPEQLYSLMANKQPTITTSLPSREQVLRMYKQLLGCYEHIVSIHVSSKLSGTYAACKQLADELNAQLSTQDISVIDSKSLSGAYGLIVKRIAQYATNYPLEETQDVIGYAQYCIDQTNIFVTVPTLDSMVASGRVSSKVGNIAAKLRLKPIVTLNKEGNAKLIKPTIFKQTNLPNLISHVKSLHHKTPIKEYVILYTDQTEQLQAIEEQLYNITGKKPSYTQAVSSVIGKYAGKGAYSIAYMA